MGNDPNSGMTCLDLDGGLVGGTKPAKLTLADFTFPSGGLVNAASDSEMKVILPGFYTCGAGCPDPRACLAEEHCERGFVGNKIGFTAGYELSPRDAARALEAAALSADGLAAAHTKLGTALEETGAALEAEQYAKRDAEFAAWYNGLDLLEKESRTAALKIAFNAGWAARKKTEYEMAYGLDTSKKP